MQQDLGSKELPFAAISLARSIPWINLQKPLFVRIEACKSIPSFQELYPQTTSKWERRQKHVQSILMHAKCTIMTKKLFNFYVKFHGYMNFFRRVITFWYSMIWGAWRLNMGSFSCSSSLKKWMLHYHHTTSFWRLTLCGGSSHKTRHNVRANTANCKIPAWRAVLIGRDNDDLHCD